MKQAHVLMSGIVHSGRLDPVAVFDTQDEALAWLDRNAWDRCTSRPSQDLWVKSEGGDIWRFAKLLFVTWEV